MAPAPDQTFYLVGGANSIDGLQGSVLTNGMRVKVFALQGDSIVAVLGAVGFSLGPTSSLSAGSPNEPGYVVQQGQTYEFTYRGDNNRKLALVSNSSTVDSLVCVSVL